MYTYMTHTHWNQTMAIEHHTLELHTHIPMKQTLEDTLTLMSTTYVHAIQGVDKKCKPTWSKCVLTKGCICLVEFCVFLKCVPMTHRHYHDCSK